MTAGRVRMGKSYARTALSQRRIGARLRGVLLGELKNVRGPLVLDIGCSTGELTAELARALKSRAGRVWGMDFDAGAVRRARRRHPGLRFLVGDMYEAPGKDARGFDAAISNEAWHWMPKPPAWFVRLGPLHYSRFPAGAKKRFSAWAMRAMRKSFSALGKRLKPGGFAVLQFGLHGQLSGVYRFLDDAVRGAAPETRRRAFFPTYYPKPAELRSGVSAAGLRIKRFKRMREDLKEGDARQFLGFLRGFTEAHLEELGGAAAAREVFEEVEAGLRKRGVLGRLRRRAWNRAILVVERR